MTRNKKVIIAMATSEGRDALKAYVQTLSPRTTVQAYIEALILKDAQVNISKSE